MFNSQILEVGIGLMGIYLILSLICSSIKEWIAGIVSSRARYLEIGLERLLNDDRIVDKFYSHPLISCLSRNAESKPSYINPNTFTMVLIDVLRSGAEGGLGKDVQGLKDVIGNLPDSTLKTSLKTMIDEAGDDLAKAKANIEDWFNSTMDRVSGWYKRFAQKILFSIAVITVTALNADTLMISNELWKNPALRASVSENVQSYVNSQGSSTNAISQNLTGAMKTLDNMHFPLGWHYNETSLTLDNGGLYWFWKILGLSITVFAVSLGAQFWFTALVKIVNLRSSGGTAQAQQQNSQGATK